MTFDVLCVLALVPLTAALVSALRKLLPSIDGKLAVFVAATAVGIGLSFAARLTVTGDTAAAWGVIFRGAGAAALAFGAASWPRWAADVLRDVLGNVSVSVPVAAAEPEQNTDSNAVQ